MSLQMARLLTWLVAARLLVAQAQLLMTRRLSACSLARLLP
jgi:hypothetical protein